MITVGECNREAGFNRRREGLGRGQLREGDVGVGGKKVDIIGCWLW
jgi:hypothetical protein